MRMVRAECSERARSRSVRTCANRCVTRAPGREGLGSCPNRMSLLGENPHADDGAACAGTIGHG